MHGFDYSMPLFVTCVRGTRIVVTLDIVSDVLHVPRVEFPNYPGCECLRTVSKDEMIFAFCERPVDWGNHQFTLCSTFVKGPRFMNMVMTFVLRPLSHYNSIIEAYTRFFLSLLKHLTIDFRSHFILSILEFYRDTANMISSPFFQLSRGFYAIFLFPFLFLTTSPLRVPLTLLPLNGARHSFI